MYSRIAFYNLWKLTSISIKMLPKIKNQSYSNIATSYFVSSSIPTHNVPIRLYSQKLQEQELLVDYEYVKKATENNKIVIIDVREPEEIKEHGKIPNSVNIPLSEVPSSLSTMSEKEFQNIYSAQKPAQDDEIIFYCMIGKRSGKAQQNALNLGFKNAKNYVGSWTDWASKQ